MTAADVARIAAAVLREYGVPLSVAGVTMEPPAGWIVSLRDIYSGGRPLAINTRCHGDTSAYRLRESLKAKLDVDQ
jgi:hypothetical protein